MIWRPSWLCWRRCWHQGWCGRWRWRCSLRSIPGLLAWSAAAWGLEGCAFLGAALALPMATLGTLIPGTPGHIGTFDYFAVQAAMLLGEPAATATAYALLIHAMIWLPPVVAGGGALIWLRPFAAADRTGEPS